MFQLCGHEAACSTCEPPGHPLLMLVSILIAALLIQPGAARAADSPFEPLKQQLRTDGFDEAFVNALYTPEVRLQLKTVAATLRVQESRLNYQQFLEPEAVRRAQECIAAYRSVLEQAQAAYGVDPYVIASILLVETGCGRNTGQTQVLAVLSTFAVLDQAAYRDLIWTRLRPEDRARWGREGFDAKLRQRAAWGLAEVKALLQWYRNQPERAKALRGSVMGALGWPQFLPSSLVRYGTDGDGNGTVNLFTAADAIHSIAKYLKGYGWDPEGTESDHQAVLYEYNHSTPYVSTILELARRLQP